MAWTTKLFESLGWNRDSLALFYLKWSACVVGLAALGDKVTALGIPKSWEPYIALAAFLISQSAAQHRTSDLPGKEN